MSKPIFIVRFPYQEGIKEHYEKITSSLEKKLSDYRVLTLIDGSVDKVEFECYNAIDATDKDIKEIKQMVLKQLNNEQ